LRAVYFVTTTMTTTGYGDLTPQPVPAQEIAAMLTMLAGVTFSGIFVALVAAYFTQSEYRLLQGLRPIHRRGHIVVCGSGRVGSRVVQFLRMLGREVVVIERNPHTDVVELARERQIDLLTGDATSDATLDLCNIPQAAAVIALTDSDAGNLEVALGARRYRDAIPVVLRVGEGAFAQSIARHFGLRNTFGTAQLAGPAFAALARAPGVRGFIAIGDREFTISEFNGARGEPDPRSVAGAVPIARWTREGRMLLMRSFGTGLTDRPLLYIHPADGG
jgi:Trk K+ transport system NAD-binding subunit